MTIYEYNLRIEAYELRHVDRLYEIHLQAFQNVRAGSKKSAGRGRMKYVFTNFKKFFDYEAALKAVSRKHKAPDSRFLSLSKHLKEEREKGGMTGG